MRSISPKHCTYYLRITKLYMRCNVSVFIFEEAYIYLYNENKINRVCKLNKNDKTQNLIAECGQRQLS